MDAGLNMVSYPDPKDYCIMNLREITNIRITRDYEGCHENGLTFASSKKHIRYVSGYSNICYKYVVTHAV